MEKKKVDIILSCLNEEDSVFRFYDEAKKYLDDKYIFNLLYIDDGSTDKTYENVKKLINDSKGDKFKISVISFTKNFGHEAAMCAGLTESKADYMIIMDVDLQNPPSKIPEIMKRFEEGADCVLLKRVKYASASLLKRFTSNGYYLFSKYILRNKNERNVSDFFAVTKELAEIVTKKYDTRLRFVRSFVQSEAKNIKLVEYENGVRCFGVSRYNYWILTKLAFCSEVSRFKIFRNMYKATKENPIYEIKNDRTIYN